MKSLNIIPVLLIALGSISAKVQEQASIPGGISIAIKAGNAAEFRRRILQSVTRVQKMMHNMQLAILRLIKGTSESTFCLRKLTRNF
jgi:hypothetical protein